MKTKEYVTYLQYPVAGLTLLSVVENGVARPTKSEWAKHDIPGPICYFAIGAQDDWSFPCYISKKPVCKNCEQTHDEP